MQVKLFSKRNKTESLVFLDNNRKHYDVQNTRKTERKLNLASFFSTFLVFSYVTVFYIIVSKHKRFCFILLKLLHFHLSDSSDSSNFFFFFFFFFCIAWFCCISLLSYLTPVKLHCSLRRPALILSFHYSYHVQPSGLLLGEKERLQLEGNGYSIQAWN